jgi:hypothetical protein
MSLLFVASSVGISAVQTGRFFIKAVAAHKDIGIHCGPEQYCMPRTSPISRWAKSRAGHQPHFVPPSLY